MELQIIFKLILNFDNQILLIFEKLLKAELSAFCRTLEESED
jgi:hypothetical protein